jgi:uncharacterized protein YjiS (DUF1127 family)
MQVVAILSSLVPARSAPASPMLARLMSPFARPVRAWHDRKTRRIIQELNTKDDFVLLDLGIRRDQIETAVRAGRFDLDTTRPR